MAKLTKTEVKQKAQDRILMVHLRQEKKVETKGQLRGMKYCWVTE
jgi:hypothetical protein